MSRVAAPAPRAVILAAGRGTRLAAAGGDVPKCLLRIRGTTLLQRQLATLHACGIEAITVVVGYQALRVARACAGLARTLENPRFAETNSLHSLWLARGELGGGAVVLNGDVLFHPQLLRDLLSSGFEDALVVEFRGQGLEPFGEEEMKVKIREGRVEDISKTLAAGEADGENVGLAKFGPEGARLLVEEMDAIVGSGRLREWAPRAFQSFARRRPLHVVGTRGLPWIEIDFPDDLARAERELAPLVDHARPRVAPPTPVPPAVAVDASETEWRPHQGHV